MVVLLVVLNFISDGTPTGHSILLGANGEKVVEGDQKTETSQFLLGEREKFDLVLTTLKLKELNMNEKKLQYADKIAKIDILVSKSENENVLSGWNALTACIEKDSCTDEYYVFMKTILNSEEAKTKKGFFSFETADTTLQEMLRNVLELKLEAEKNNIILRSKLVTETNSLIATKGFIEMKELWEQLVECSFTCEGYDKLLSTITESYFEKR